MRRPTLLLDMDGPLADFDQHFWAQFRNIRGYEFDIDHLDHPDRHRFLTDNMPNRTQRRLARNYINNTDWFRRLPVTEGALAGVALLMEYFDVWVCTKPLEANPRCRDHKAEWLRWHFPELEEKLIIAPDKSKIVGDILLDDAPKISWIPDACWLPVIFPAPFNDAASEWGDLPAWTWGDSIDELLGWL